MMVNRSSVHVESRENGWAVVREGSERATSLHQTQAEAAKEGRDIARREETEFFLHAQDGRVREHRSYGAGAPSAEEAATDQTSGPLDAVTETVDQLTTGVVSATVGALGGAGGGKSSEEPDDKREARDMAHDQHDRSLEERYAGYDIYD